MSLLKFTLLVLSFGVTLLCLILYLFVTALLMSESIYPEEKDKIDLQKVLIKLGIFIMSGFISMIIVIHLEV